MKGQRHWPDQQKGRTAADRKPRLTEFFHQKVQIYDKSLEQAKNFMTFALQQNYDANMTMSAKTSKNNVLCHMMALRPRQETVLDPALPPDEDGSMPNIDDEASPCTITVVRDMAITFLIFDEETAGVTRWSAISSAVAISGPL